MNCNNDESKPGYVAKPAKQNSVDPGKRIDPGDGGGSDDDGIAS